MILLLADVNIQGHVETMARRMQAEPFMEFWNDLELSCVSFADVGLNLGGFGPGDLAMLSTKEGLPSDEQSQ